MIRMINKTERMRRLVGKFLDGETSRREERVLYAYFTSPDVADELADYKLMFADFAIVGNAHTRRATTQTPLWRAVIGMAAVALLVFGAITVARLHEERQLALLYEGSYVIDNGRRIDNLREIKGYVEMALNEAETIEQQNVVEQAETHVLENISDPQLKRDVEEILNE